jgi:glycerophosphodiester phosphodiesterase
MWLLKVTEDMAKLSASPGIKRVSSAVRLGCPESDAIKLDEYIAEDKAEALLKRLTPLQVEGLHNDVVLKLLQRAISLKSIHCIQALFPFVTTLHESNDLYERSIIHKYIINFGRTKALQLANKTRDNAFYITPTVTSRASSPTRLGRVSNPTEQLDDIAILRIILDNIPVTMRSTLITPEFNKRMPIHYAALYGLYKACELLAQYMCQWNLVTEPLLWDQPQWADVEGLTPLHLAVMGSHKLTLMALLDAENRDPFTPIVRPVCGQPVLTLAVKEDATEIVKQLVSAGMDINYQDSNGETALHHACRLGHTDSILVLLQGTESQKCQLELSETTFGWTALFVAAVEGFTAIVELLVEAGAETDKPDNSGWMAYEHAYFRGHLECGRKIFPVETPPINSVISRTGSPDFLSKSPGSRSDARIETVKSFGHRYLVGKSMIVVTLGSTDVRKPTFATPVSFDKVPLTKAIPTHLDAALSLVVTAKGAEGDPYVFDLPFHEMQATDSLVFYATDPEKVQLLFDIVPTYAGNKDKIVGRAIALLSSVRTNVGRGRSSLHGGVTLPIIEGASLNVIGTISFEFIAVTPFEHPNMNIGPNSTYWKSLITTRVIGHRGLGKNENARKSLQLGENTLHSFIAAANLGASYVEMDVQLTKDNIPVIYHDFLVTETGIDAPMHQLTLEQVVTVR